MCCGKLALPNYEHNRSASIMMFCVRMLCYVHVLLWRFVWMIWIVCVSILSCQLYSYPCHCVVLCSSCSTAICCVVFSSVLFTCVVDFNGICFRSRSTFFCFLASLFPLPSSRRRLLLLCYVILSAAMEPRAAPEPHRDPRDADLEFSGH